MIGHGELLATLVVVFLILPTALLNAQEIDIPATVVGYTGYDVILPCKLRNSKNTTVSQLQWDHFVGNISKPILIYNLSQVSIPDSSLKGRLYLQNSQKDDFSVVIREAAIADRGPYTCKLATFPGGNIQKNTELVVQDQMSVGGLIGIVTAIAVLLVIMVAYLVIARKRKTSLLNHIVPSDISGPEADKTGASEAKREEDLVYIGFNQPTRSGDNILPSNEKHAEEGDITYSQVAMAHPKSK